MGGADNSGTGIANREVQGGQISLKIRGER